MSASRSKSRVVRVLSAAALGMVLGLVDAALHGEPAEWPAAPMAALLGIANLSTAYGLLGAAVGAVIPWRLFVYLAPGSFAAFQAVIAYVRLNPAAEPVGHLVAGASALAVAILAAFVASKVFGSTQPHTVVAGPAAAALGLVLLVALLAREPSAADGHARPPAPSALAVRAGVAKDARRPNVLLLTLDTLRADRLGVYGYRGVRTPNLDALGTEGALMRNAVTQAPTTPPSHASILTGLYPARHGIRGFESGLSLPPDHPTLAELLAREGYATGAVIASVPLRPGSGIERGYDEYSFEMPPASYAFYGFRETVAARLLKRLQIVTDRSGYRPGRTQTDLAIDWISRHADRPWFLWVHYFDTHDPYSPPARHLMTGAHPGAGLADVLKRSYLYDSEVAYLDEQIGRLIAYLGDAALLDGTIVAGISDHGEALGEHNYVGHSHKIYQEQVHGVFLMRYPAGIPAGAEITAQIRNVDYYPTILELTGIDVPDGIDGSSLAPLFRAGGRGEDRLAITETVSADGNRMIGVSDGRYKLIAEPGAGAAGREELYDLTRDPRELDNLIERTDLAAIVAPLRSAIGDYIARTIESGGGETHIEADVRGRLRALGYLD